MFLLSFTFMQDVLRNTEDHDFGPAVSHLFNCFFGSCQAAGAKVAANTIQSRTHRKVCNLDKQFQDFLCLLWLVLLFSFELLSANS
jgi:hypothetical protein